MNHTQGAPAPVSNAPFISAVDAAAIGIVGLVDAVALFSAIERLTNDETIKEPARIGLRRADECRDQVTALQQDVDEAIERRKRQEGEQ